MFDGQRFTNLTTKDGLVHNHISAIHQVADGTFWIGTLGGLSHYNGQNFINFTMAEGLVSNAVSDIHQSSDGMLWITTKDTETGKKTSSTPVKVLEFVDTMGPHSLATLQTMV